jgi:hypothetical protein
MAATDDPRGNGPSTVLPPPLPGASEPSSIPTSPIHVPLAEGIRITRALGRIHLALIGLLALHAVQVGLVVALLVMLSG